MFYRMVIKKWDFQCALFPLRTFFFTTLFISLKGSENNKFFIIIKSKQTLGIFFLQIITLRVLNPQLHPCSSVPLLRFSLDFRSNRISLAYLWPRANLLPCFSALAIAIIASITLRGLSLSAHSLSLFGDESMAVFAVMNW